MVMPGFFLGAKKSRLVFSSCVSRMEAALPQGNKFLRPFLHLAGAYSAAGGGLVRFELAGSGYLGAPVPVGSSLGVVSRPAGASAGKMKAAWCSACRGDGFRAVDVRYEDLVCSCAVFRRQVQILDQGGAGRIPGRCSSTEYWILPVVVGVFCGSCQSHSAMVLLLIYGGIPSSLISSVSWCGGGVRRTMVLLEDAVTLQGLVGFSLFDRGLCVVWLGSLPLCILCVHAVSCMRICTFSLHLSIYASLSKKKSQGRHT